MKILVIDNTPGSADLLRQQLEDHDGVPVEIRRADTLSTALPLLVQETVDLIFLDPALFEQNGDTAITALAHHACGIPVIFLGGQAMEGSGKQTALYIRQGGRVKDRGFLASRPFFGQTSSGPARAIQPGSSYFLESGSLLQAQPVPQFAIGLDHTIVHWNAPLEKFCGIPAGEVTGTGSQWRVYYSEERPCLADLLIDGELERDPQQYERVVDPSSLLKDTYTMTGYFPDAGGDGRWLTVTATLIRDAQGTVTGALETFEDITARKEMEQKLAESGKRYQRFIEATTDYIYSVRIENGCAADTRHGPGCQSVTGYMSEEFAADPSLWIRMVVEEDRHAVMEQACSLLAGRASGTVEHRIIRKDGTERWVRNTPVPEYGPDGRIIAYDGLVQDITRQKQAETALKHAYEEVDAQVRERTAELVTLNESLKAEISCREQLLATLQESEAIYRTVGEVIPYGTWISTPSGEITYLSQSFLGMTGRTLDECKGFGWISCLSPRDADITMEKWKQCFERSGPLDCVYQIQDCTGRSRSILSRGVPVRNKAGQILSWTGINLDITERERTRQLLEDRTHQLDSAEQIAHLGSWEWDIRSGAEYWSDELYRIFGYEPRKIRSTYQMFVNAIHPDDKDNALDIFLDAVDGKKPYSVEFRIVRPDGEIRYIDAHGEVERNEYNIPVKMVGSIQDITGRRQAEESVRASEMRLRTTIENNEAAYFCIGLDGHIRDVNKAWLTLYGFTSADEAVGRHISVIRDGKDRENVRQFLDILRQKKPVSHADFTRLCSDGVLTYHIITADPVLEHGRTVAMEGFLFDITGVKRTEDEIKNALIEKDDLINKLHCEIKKTLQVIPWIVTIGTGEVRDTDAGRALQTIHDRFRLIACACQESGLSENIHAIECRSYLTRITSFICQSYAIDPGRTRILVDTDTMFMGISRAIPCALIINELFAQVFCNASLTETEGDIRIRLAADDGSIFLSFSVNGNSLLRERDIFPPETAVSGLIPGLMQQLQATIDHEQTSGSMFTLAFPQTPGDAKMTIDRNAKPGSIRKTTRPDPADRWPANIPKFNRSGAGCLKKGG